MIQDIQNQEHITGVQHFQLCIIIQQKYYQQKKQDFITNFNNYKGQNDATYIDTDYINNVPQITSKYNIYSYNYLDDIFIYIKNDWDQEYVRQETSDAITYLNLKYIYKRNNNIKHF